jgi:tRNA-dihydrouridine synthase B
MKSSAKRVAEFGGECGFVEPGDEARGEAVAGKTFRAQPVRSTSVSAARLLGFRTDAYWLADHSNAPVSFAAGGLHQPAVPAGVREVGGVGLCTTDLVNARSLLEKRAKALKLIETNAADSPLAVQLFGSVPEEMRDAAALLEARGCPVDINMGCPVRKVVKVGGGSAMMTELDKTAALVRGMVNAVKIPVTAKMRLGWDDDNLTAPDLARALEDVGVAAIFVHGRTRQQGFGGTVNLAGIRKVVEAVKTIPVIGNGDVITPQAAKKMFDETGCAGVSIGRGAFYNPWIFAHTNHYRRRAQLLPEPSFASGCA